MKRSVFLSLLLTAVVLLLPTFLLVGCENLGETAITATSLAQGPMPNPEFPPVPGAPPPGENLPGGTPGEPMPPGGAPGDVTPPGGTPGGGATPTTAKTTATTASNSGVTMMVAEALPLNLTATRYEETDSHLVWTGVWGSGSNANYSGGGWRQATGPGASVTVKFSGTNLKWIGQTGDFNGIAEVTLDGGSPTQVDTYSDPDALQKILWQSGNLAWGSHTVKIECTGTCIPGADPYIVVDAFDVVGTLE